MCRGEEEDVNEEISLWFISLLQEVSRKVVDGRDTGLFYFENVVLIQLMGWEIRFKKTLVEYKGSVESLKFAKPT